ncbi:hypothetical protein D3C72_2033950 [compost metagenome]
MHAVASIHPGIDAAQQRAHPGDACLAQQLGHACGRDLVGTGAVHHHLRLRVNRRQHRPFVQRIVGVRTGNVRGIKRHAGPHIQNDGLLAALEHVTQLGHRQPLHTQ